MDPKEFEQKFREFMNKELPGNNYQMLISYTDGSVSAEGGIQVKTQIIGFDTKQVPFAVAHALFKSLEMAAVGMIQGIYGNNNLRPETQRLDETGMHR